MSLAADRIVSGMLQQGGDATTARATLEKKLKQHRGEQSLEVYFAHLLEAPLEVLSREVCDWVDALKPSAVAAPLSDLIALLDLAAQCGEGESTQRLRRLAEVLVKLSQKYPLKRVRRGLNR